MYKITEMSGSPLKSDIAQTLCLTREDEFKPADAVETLSTSRIKETDKTPDR
jgi:hypothetical protein